MRKRFNLTWRIMVALILVLSLVPALITATGTVAAATGPSVYLDPLPAYVSSAMLPGLTFSGTSLATGPRTIKDVLVQIKFKDSVTSTWLYWDGAADAWSTIADSYNYAETITTPGAWGTQTDWEWDGSGPDIFPVAANLSDGMTYTVTVWAMDDNMDKGASVSRTFIYDKTLPSGSAILVIGDANSGTGWVATSITTISGSARDTAPGAVGQVWVEIDDNTAGHGWDGVTWNGAVGQWILASGTTSWSVTTSTTTPLPNWISGHSYTVTIYVFDKAGNQETSAPTQNFTYLKVPATGLDIYMDILPAYMQGVDFVNVSGVAKSSGSTNDILNVSIKIYNNAAQYWDENFPCDWKIGDPQPWNLAYPLDGVAFDSPTEAWYYDDTACWPIIHDGYTYTITARTYQTSTTKKESASQNVVIDNTSPIDTVITSMGITTYLGTTVFQGTSYEDLVQGTANDNTAGIAPGKLAKVSVTIQDSTDGVAWDGIAWGAGADLRTVAKDGSFNSNAEGWKITDATTPSLPTWKHDHHYVITAWATDAAGNVEAPNAIINFWYVKDLSGTAPVPTPTPTEAPTPTPAPALTCAVTNPTNNANLSALVSINGTSADDVAVLGLKVRICNSSSGLCWNGSAWVANLSLVDAPAATASDGTFNSISETWFYTTLPTWDNGSTYQVQAQATDATTTPANSSAVSFGFGVTPVTPTPTPTVAPATPTPTATTVPTPTTVVPTPTPTTTPSGTNATKAIPASGGEIITADENVKITFPAGAFTGTSTVTIAGASCNHGDAGKFKVVSGACFTVTSTLTLGGTATICVDVSGYDESNLTLGYWDGSTWVEASNVTLSADGNTLCGETTHFSDWAVLSNSSWPWWYWALIGGGAVIIVIVIVLLIVLPKRRKGEEIPSEELYGEEEEEF